MQKLEVKDKSTQRVEQLRADPVLMSVRFPPQDLGFLQCEVGASITHKHLLLSNFRFVIHHPVQLLSFAGFEVPILCKMNMPLKKSQRIAYLY